MTENKYKCYKTVQLSDSFSKLKIKEGCKFSPSFSKLRGAPFSDTVLLNQIVTTVEVPRLVVCIRSNLLKYPLALRQNQKSSDRPIRGKEHKCLCSAFSVNRETANRCCFPAVVGTVNSMKGSKSTTKQPAVPL